MSLGFLPIPLWIGAAVLTGGALTWGKGDFFQWLGAGGDSANIYGPPTPAPAPAAPQTRSQLTQSGQWTPDSMYTESQQQYSTWVPTAISNPNNGNDSDGKPDLEGLIPDWLPWAMIGAFGLVMVTKR